MPNLATVLKSEIVRLARKELKAELAHIRKQVAAHRTALAALRRQVAELERLAKRKTPLTKTPQSTGDTPSRFSVKGLKTLRAKLGLSAADFGRLVGVTGTTVYNWEGEKARPRASQVQALASLRGLGRKAALAKLDKLAR